MSRYGPCQQSSHDFIVERISWHVICSEFGAQFEKLCLNKKVHFDSYIGERGTPEVVTLDGVTNKWRNAFLLDAIVCNYRGQYDDQCARRGFDHHVCLRLCVCRAIIVAKKEGYVPWCDDVLSHVDSSWVSFEAFLRTYRNHTHSKKATRDKARLIFSSFCPSQFPGLTLPGLINRVVRKIWISSLYNCDLVTGVHMTTDHVQSLLGSLRPNEGTSSRLFEQTLARASIKPIPVDEFHLPVSAISSSADSNFDNFIQANNLDVSVGSIACNVPSYLDGICTPLNTSMTLGTISSSGVFPFDVSAFAQCVSESTPRCNLMVNRESEVGQNPLATESVSMDSDNLARDI